MRFFVHLFSNDVDARLQRIESELQTMKQVQRTNVSGDEDADGCEGGKARGSGRCSGAPPNCFSCFFLSLFVVVACLRFCS